MTSRAPRGAHVLVAGAGLAGLAAARALEARGHRASVIEARDRVGGRVWTIRDGLEGGQHAEGGGDFIESDQQALVDLVKELGLRLVPIIRRGFGFYGTDRRGHLTIQSMESSLRTMAAPLAPLIRDYRLAERRWDSAIAQQLARQTVAEWLDTHHVDSWVRRRCVGMRGLFLADPEDLSLLALVDFFSDVEESGFGGSHRVVDGNDRVATEIARRLETPPEMGALLRRVRQEGRRIVATIETSGGLSERTADYLVITIPASTLRDVVFDPPLPDPQREAIATLAYGKATRLLLQFKTRFWADRSRPNAFGSDQSIGAVWDGNEQQRRGGRAILSFLAGGGASDELQALMDREGLHGVLARLEWLGQPAAVLAHRTITWEHDPWARGGYACFTPQFDPRGRDWLARPHGRVLFAGEHTSIRWQGYMNGAVESGQRAAAEIVTLEQSC